MVTSGNQVGVYMRIQKRGNKIQIDNLQLFTMMIATIVGYGHFVYVHLSYVAAGRDAWFSMMIGFLIGLGVLLLQFRLSKHHPNQSLVQITQGLFGAFIGTPLSILYVLFFCFVSALTATELTSFLTLMYPTTPSAVFLLAEFLLVTWVTRGGLEVIVRTIQLIFPILVLLGSTAALATLPDKDPASLLPLLDRPIGPLAQGSIVYIVMFSELVVFGMFLHEARSPQQIPKHGLRTFGLLIIMFIGPVTGPIMVFGETLARALTYPTYTEIQYINLSGIIERLDVVGVILWTFGSFIRISVFLFGATKAMSQIAGNKSDSDYTLPIVLFIVGLTVSMSSLSREELHHFLLTTYPIIAISIGYLIPGLTVIWHLLRTRKPKRIAPARTS